ncbi:MAG: mechanosensitive ion channel [Sulfurovaceae bacterium]|nr:mechanosensitive ion channel [Sulfurovaceae bacterium]MDD5548874.1 mechanosensitive ion channel [Sulfurovaceae bacterium]
MIIKKSFLLFTTILFFLVGFAFGDTNASQEQITSNNNFKSEITNINDNINDNEWIATYDNYNNYQTLNLKKEDTEYKIQRLSKKINLTIEQKNKLQSLKDELSGINSKILLLGEYDNEPFKKLLSPNKIDDKPKISNPFGIFYALSYQEKLRVEQKEFHERYSSLSNLLNDLETKKTILENLIKVSKDNKENYQELEKTINLIKTFKPLQEIMGTTKNIYDKKIYEIKYSLAEDITKESKKLMLVGIIIGILFAFLLLSKYIARKYLRGTEKLYTANKALNITFIFFTILLLLFVYIENVSYLVTILGFASAGMAIALKEWFTSIMGWFVIFFGNSIHVGERIKFIKDGAEYVGDVIDISLLKITMLEDVTLTTFERNRRAGRVIYIPNNFIFTNMLANYSHEGLDTVWDGIDFVVTFDSNIQKVSDISKEITTKYSKKFSDNTRKNLNKLKRKYHLRNTNVEPSVFTLLTPYGIKISVWYLTNSYATLALRSTISASIINAIKNEDDIILAYPTQAINLGEDKQKHLKNEKTEETK